MHTGVAVLVGENVLWPGGAAEGEHFAAAATPLRQALRRGWWRGGCNSDGEGAPLYRPPLLRALPPRPLLPLPAYKNIPLYILITLILPPPCVQAWVLDALPGEVRSSEMGGQDRPADLITALRRTPLPIPSRQVRACGAALPPPCELPSRTCTLCPFVLATQRRGGINWPAWMVHGVAPLGAARPLPASSGSQGRPALCPQLPCILHSILRALQSPCMCCLPPPPATGPHHAADGAGLLWRGGGLGGDEPDALQRRQRPAGPDLGV